jgi:hypothetical protein
VVLLTHGSARVGGLTWEGARHQARAPEFYDSTVHDHQSALVRTTMSGLMGDVCGAVFRWEVASDCSVVTLLSG